MKYTFLFFASIFMLVSSCKNKKKSDESEDAISKTQDSCITKSEKESIIMAILSTEDFQMFLHPSIEGRLPVKLLKNDFVTPDLKLQSNGYPVMFKDSLILPEGDVNRLKIIKKDCENKEFSYSVFYPIEAASMSGTVFKSDTLWLVKDTNWGEID